MRLNELIRSRRLELGKSQVDLGIETGLAQRTISDIERGVTKHPTYRILESLARSLRLPIEQLVVVSGYAADQETATTVAGTLKEQAGEDPIAAAVLLELGKMDEDHRRVVLSHVRELRRLQDKTERDLS